MDRTLAIGAYDLTLPSWWDEVDVDLPAGADREPAMRDHVRRLYGGDAGTKETWRAAAKAWALWARGHGVLPIDYAHCLMTGEHYRGAARVYGELHARTNREWTTARPCRLAYFAAGAHRAAGDVSGAVDWYLKTVEFERLHREGFNRDTQFMVTFLVEQARAALRELMPVTTGETSGLDSDGEMVELARTFPFVVAVYRLDNTDPSRASPWDYAVELRPYNSANEMAFHRAVRARLERVRIGYIDGDAGTKPRFIGRAKRL
jgi:hypothetical protein